ncbi:hypothetical protein G6F49_006289 [Rhizopus delemar]|nr:hypothetical protein G6F49_006289 [Rhizopus delemar]
MFNIQSAFTYRTVPDYAEECVKLSLQNGIEYDNWYRNVASQPGCWVKPLSVKSTFYVCDHADIVQSRLPVEVKRWIEEHVDDALDSSIDNDNSSSVALRCEKYAEDTEKYLSMYNSIVKRKLNEVKTKKELKKDSRGLFHSEACVLRDFEDFTFCGTDNGLLHNYYSVLDDDNKAAPVVQDIELQKYLKTPKVTIISASEIDFGCGAFKQRVKRQTGKKLTRKGKEAQLIENSLSQKVRSTSNVSVEQFKHNFDAHVEHRKKLRDFYNTGNRMNERRHREIQKHRFTHRICTKKLKALSQTSGNNPSTKKKLVMFIGDRGTGVGFRIKGFKRYGGRWKEVIHSEAANVCITNENLTSKTCIFCFRRLTHPRISVTKNGEVFSRKVKGSFYCTNPLCVSVLSKCAAKSRDSLSALAIGIVGLSTVLFGAPLPAFKSHKISNIEVEKYTILTSPSRFEEEIGSYAVVLEVRKGLSKVDHPEIKIYLSDSDGVLRRVV